MIQSTFYHSLPSEFLRSHHVVLASLCRQKIARDYEVSARLLMPIMATNTIIYR